MLCKYSDIFGKPDTGVHKYKVGGIAIVDLGLTIVGAHYLSKSKGYSFGKTLLGLLVLGEVMHVAFCVDTGFLRIMNSKK